jgi:archaellum component FlaC
LTQLRLTPTENETQIKKLETRLQEIDNNINEIDAKIENYMNLY